MVVWGVCTVEYIVPYLTYKYYEFQCILQNVYFCCMFGLFPHLLIFTLQYGMDCCAFLQEWRLSFTSVQAVHEQTQQSGQNVVSSTARLGQERVIQQLRDLTAQLVSLDDDARRLEASLNSSLKAYQEFDTTASELTAWLTDTESHLEQLNKIDFWASENLEADYKVL